MWAGKEKLGVPVLSLQLYMTKKTLINRLSHFPKTVFGGYFCFFFIFASRCRERVSVPVRHHVPRPDGDERTGSAEHRQLPAGQNGLRALLRVAALLHAVLVHALELRRRAASRPPRTGTRLFRAI